MVISKIIGGLGNQMFQYAVGRALAMARSCELRLDVRGFDGYTLHNGFELGRVFNISTQPASHADYRRVLGWRGSPPMLQALQKDWLSFLRGPRIAVEPGFNFWPSIEKAPDDCYLAGYWQSEKYFQRYERQIRADFSFRDIPYSRNRELGERISDCNAVSVHVRRGDYATNPVTLATHGLCPPDYYHRAIRYVSERVMAPEFFVFSDDIEWARANIMPESNAHYIGHNHGKDSYNDLRLMSLCRHHVIANSSFSWWGAWLNAASTKIVVAPERWFADGRQVPDLLPFGWVTL